MYVLLLWCTAYYGHSLQCLPPQRFASVRECQIVARHQSDIAIDLGGAVKSTCLTIRH
jgi:hypothetical protein